MFESKVNLTFPAVTRGKPEAIVLILQWVDSQVIIGLELWGKWEHMNSDVAVAEVLATAAKICAKDTK